MRFNALLDRFVGMKALVVGDLMLDEYVFGRATRISPEAPVMVVRHQRTSRVPGGAANVARNITSLGGVAKTVGVAGCDEGGNLLENSLIEYGLNHTTLLRDPDRSTTRKTRVLADHTHQVIRIDQEDDLPIASDLEDRLIAAAVRHIDECDVVVMSDYLKGVLTERVTRTILDHSCAKGKPAVANPKPRSVGLYAGAALLSLNRSEAAETLSRHDDLLDQEAPAFAERLRDHLSTPVLVTLGESGMVACGLETFVVAAPKVEVYDTAGAGDTVIAAAALGLAGIGFKREVFELAALAAGSVVRHVGVATPSREDLEAIRAL